MTHEGSLPPPCSCHPSSGVKMAGKSKVMMAISCNKKKKQTNKAILNLTAINCGPSGLRTRITDALIYLGTG